MGFLKSLLSTSSQIQSRLGKYRRYREMSDDLHSKILGVNGFGKFIHTASVHLGFSRVVEELFAGPPTDLSIVVDYAEQQVLDRGKSFLEIYRDSTARHSPEEQELLERWINSPVGLYRLIDSDADTALVTAEDVTDPSNRITMTDFGLSVTHSYHKRAYPNDSQMSFLRPIQFEDFAMCSGFMCAFPPAAEREVLKLWRKYDGPVRYASIVRLFKSKGELIVNTSELSEYLQ